MNKNFISRVMREGIVDTKIYRYRLVEDPSGYFIQRLPLSALNTTAALDGWEIVHVF